MARPLVVAVLESMWDWRGMTSGAGYDRAPPHFVINRDNFSGRRLYRIVGDGPRLLVTNACPQLVTRASEHGTPDPDWLRANLKELEGFSMLLLCGKVAQKTFRDTEIIYPKDRTIEMMHPAARMWTNKMLDEATARVAKALESETTAAA